MDITAASISAASAVSSFNPSVFPNTGVDLSDTRPLRIPNLSMADAHRAKTRCTASGVVKVRSAAATSIILSCGHWYFLCVSG